MVAITISAHTSNSPYVYTGDEQTGDRTYPTTTENPASGVPLLIVKKTFRDVVDVEPSGT